MASARFNPATRFSRRLLLVSLTLLSASFSALGQTQNPRTTAPVTPSLPSPVSATPASAAESRTNADETFELNIVERRYSQENFEASTAVETPDDSQKLKLQIGVALASGRIDVLLRNVRGTVRFRGSLERVFKLIGDPQTPAPANSPEPTAAPSPRQ